MKDQINKYIETNKEELDLVNPETRIWDKIESELHPEEKKRAGIWFWSGAAASVLLVVFLVTKNSFNNGEMMAENTPVDLKAVKPAVQAFKKPDHGELDNNVSTGWEYGEAESVSFPKGEQSSVYTPSASGSNTLGLTVDNVSSGTFYSWDFGDNFETDAAASSHYGTLSGNNSSMTISDSISINFNTLSQQYSGSTYVPKEPSRPVGYYYERYDDLEENKFMVATDDPLSTFSIDVDGASYSNMRRFINSGMLPPKNSIRLEEMINYFDYKIPAPSSDSKHPFRITTEMAQCPWNKENKLVQISLKGKEIEKSQIPKNNLVFLVDVSGSMDSYDKLGLLKRGLRLLVQELREEDRVAIAVYAGAAGLVLPSTSGANKDRILDALDGLTAGGSTAGGEGIQLAYRLAKENYIQNGNNRIILVTDGDFNVGVTNDDELVELIEDKRKSGVSLSVMGFGTGNIQDSKMEKLADNGNGNYSYIDNVLEAKKVMVTEMGGTLTTIAKDVKLQVEFNPKWVDSYRLVGYENRKLEHEDFDDDKKDAGELGAGHTIVAIYEITPRKGDSASSGQELKYQKTVPNDNEAVEEELLTVKFRYKQPKGTKSKLIVKTLNYSDVTKSPSQTFRFAASVAEFGLLLRDSEYKGKANFSSVLRTARNSKGMDHYGYRSEFIQLVEKTEILLNRYQSAQTPD